MVWGANFAVRRSAVERIGEFDESLDREHGDEEEWLLRLREAGGRIVYLAEAGLDHRRSPGDSNLGHSRAPHATAAAGRLERPPPPAPPPASPASCACWPAGTPSAEHAPRD